jgi:Concanavalin A-like lectin/glucanases superfamily
MASDEFATEVLADGPVGYWRLGEPLGSATAADASGNGNVGSASGGVTFGQPGLHGGDTAALFDGATGRITVANSETLNPAQITMEAMVRWDGATGFQQRILEKESFAGTTQYGLSVQPDGRIRVELRKRVPGPAQGMSADSTGVAAPGAETHVAATYDGLAIAIYLNGALDSTTTVNASPVEIDTKWPHSPPDDPEVALALGDRIGIIPAGGAQRVFNGLIDEIALYAAPLSAERIRVHYEARRRPRVTFQYAAKVVCGRSAGKVVAAGTYLTAVNIHNPQDTEVRFTAKVAVALPGFTPGPVSPKRDAALGPDEALEVDCPDIRRLAETKDKFVKGFLVLESVHELDVVCVYTVAGTDGEVRALEIERVPARTRTATA